MNRLLAKSTKEGNTTLIDHTKMVLNLGMCIAENFNIQSGSKEKFLEHLAMALLLHDIGKCSTNFQKYIKNCICDGEGMEASKNNSYYHNTLSWAFAIGCISDLRKNNDVISSILYHHVVRDNITLTAKDIITDIMDKDNKAFEYMCHFYEYMIDYVDSTFGLNIKDLPKYKLISEYFDIDGECDKLSDAILYHKTVFSSDSELRYRSIMESESFSGIIRAIVVFCDRTISSNKYDNQRIIENDIDYMNSLYATSILSNKIEPSYHDYDMGRLANQIEIVSKIQNSNVLTNVLQASAGFGKTLIGLLWYFAYSKKTMWVLPRNVIASGTYDSVIKELDKMCVNDKVRVALYHGGEFQNCNYCNVSDCTMDNCDILITNIDTFLSCYSKNNMSKLLINGYCGNVIFDEYHEFINETPMFSAFTNMMYVRMNYGKANTLLLSATGINLDKFWGGNCYNIKYWNDLPILYGDVKVNIHVEDITNGIPSYIVPNSFTILPTVPNAQSVYFSTTKPSVIIHSRYTSEDRRRIEQYVYNMYGKGANDEKLPVIGTNIIGVGLDISAKVINDGCVNPEDTIQRGCGRGSRYGEYDKIDYNVLVNKSKGNAKFINNTYDNVLHEKWVEMLTTLDGKQVTKKDLYDLRSQFYTKYKKEYSKYIENLYNTSVNSLIEIRHKSGSTYSNTEEKKITNGMTYRGESNSVFVTVKTNDGYIEPIACDINIVDRESDGHNKERFEFMTNNKSHGFTYPNIYALKNGYGIKKNNASPDKCISIAYSNKSPLLLYDYEYNDAGLYYIGEN